MFTGLKIKQYSDQELEAFKGPFLKGWRREVVLRGTVSNSGKKIGDVYYYSPDKKTKLRSYVEMGLFLRKNSGCGLEPENFTFARQPVYKPPEEIVRHAMTRGSNQAIDHFLTASPAVIAAPPPAPSPAPALTPIVTPTAPSAKAQIVTRRSQSTAETPETPDCGQTEGRAKRKRVAPTRFEDEEYLDNSPFKKKTDKQPIRSEKIISPIATPTVTGNAVPAGLSKTIETKVNAQGRTSIIIRTPIRKVSGATQLDSKNALVGNHAIGTNSKPVPDVKEKLDANQGASLSSSDTSDKDAGSSVGSEVRSVSKSESQAESPIQQNGSQEALKPISSAPPALQPIRITNSGPVTTPAAARKESRPAGQQTNSQQPNMRKASIINKNGRSILSQNANQMRVSSDTGSGWKPIRPKPSPRAEMPDDRMDGQVTDDGAPVPPCSIMCGGRQGHLPSLLCSRCLCLFHPQCVQRGIHLNQGNQFVCPNCIQPSDQGRPVILTNGTDESAGTGSRSTGKLQPSSRNSSRGPSPLHFASSLIRNQQIKSSSGFKSQPQQDRGSITTMMDKRQQSQLQLLQTFRQIAGIRSKNSTSGRPVISRPVRKQQVVQNRGHLRLSAAVPGRESRSLFPQNHVRVSKTRDAPTPPTQMEQPEAPAAPAPANHQHLSELISHHLDSVSRLLQEITMLKYSNCQKVSLLFMAIIVTQTT